MCKKRSGPSYCTAHIENGQVEEAFSQSDKYRSIATFSSGTGVLAAGDFNLSPSQTADWIVGGYLEADSGSNQPTAGTQQWDYVWRLNYGNFPHLAYVAAYAPSDHKWYQAYLPS